MQITIILPTFNEAENLPKLVSALFSLPVAVNLLVVDDNSPDGTGEIAEKLAREHPGRIKVLHRPGKLGLGTAYIMGFKQALADGADAIGQMDSDFSHPPEKLVEMAAALERADVAIGSRYVAGGSLDKDWPLWRKGLSAWGNFYARTILGLKQRDVTGGFRLWSRKAMEGLPLERIRSNGYIFQVEISYLSKLLGFTFKEVPIYFAERRLGKSKMSFRIQLEAAVRVWQLRGMYRDLEKH
ncbi:MAG TPA: polyprenol monophosphomannose synthase [Anaerolineaceae bacterium]|nr:polyprenol monophosphomannose synthase [Anaerolineaceae bacterium]HPN50136.1 polyprenol monophosphomannose synthase [Anaerolineaceae bacterium]